MNISEQLSITAANQPDKDAYIFQDKKTSYHELEEQISRFAYGLQQLGYEKGDHIALITWNTPYFVIVFYGALRIGVVVIPINPLYTNEEISYILENADAKGIVTMDLLMDQFEEIADMPHIEHYIVCESSEKMKIYLQQKSIKLFSNLMEDTSSTYERVPLYFASEK